MYLLLHSVYIYNKDTSHLSVGACTTKPIMTNKYNLVCQVY